MHAIPGAAIDHDNLILCRIDHGAAIDRHNAAIHVAFRGARSVIGELALRFGHQTVTNTHFFFSRNDVNGCGHDVGRGLAVCSLGLLGGFAANQRGTTNVLRFVSQYFASTRVFQGCGVSEDAVLLFLALVVQQRRIGRAAGIGAVSLGQQHPAFALLSSRHDAGRGSQSLFVHHDGLGQERFDLVEINGGQGTTAQSFIPGAWRHLDGIGRGITGTRGAGTQGGAAVFLFQE